MLVLIAVRRSVLAHLLIDNFALLVRLYLSAQLIITRYDQTLVQLEREFVSSYARS